MSNVLNFTFESRQNIRTILVENEIFFVANDICVSLGLTNTSSVVKSIPMEDKLLIDPKLYFGSKSNQQTWVVNESGLYFLIFKSKKKETIKFKKWITSEVLPMIRKYGSYSVFKDNSFSRHINTNEQIKNSKLINSKNYQSGGINEIIKHNKENCIIHTGKTTQFVKNWGKSQGLKSKDTISAKQVLRKTAPHIASAMSFADSLLYHNPDKTLNDISKISLSAIEVFDAMIKLNIVPIELKN